jgi:hypothetical protein
MFSNRLAVGVLAVACVTAAGLGGYFAARQTTVPAPVAAQSQPADFAPAAGSTASTPSAGSRPVTETEAVVGDAVKPSATSPSAAPVTSPSASAAAGSSKSKTTRRTEAVSASRPPTPTRQARTTAAAPSQPPPLASSWPSNAGSSSGSQAPGSSASTSATDTGAGTTRTDERQIPESSRVPDPPQKTFEELVVSADSVIGLQTETRISSETAKVEDRVDAKVSRDVKVGDKVAIPAGTKAQGSVTLVERGGKFKERARLGIRFHTLLLPDGTRVPISTDVIYREGDAPGNSSAAKVGGGAVGGAILGAILGGAKGAAIGATAGAGGGTAAVMAGDRSSVTIAAGTPMTVRILSPITVTTEKE